MEHEVSHSWLAPRRAWLAWGVLWLLFAAEGLLGRPPSVGRVYRESARQWWAQQPLYNQIGKGFLYLPHAAVLQTPFASLAERGAEGWAEVAWRTLTIGLFALGVQRLAKLAAAGAGAGGDTFGWMTLVSIPLGFSAARNGQAQLIVAGLAMLTAEALCRRQWNRAAAWLWIGLAFKPVMLPFLLVAGVLHAPLRGRLAVGGVLFALVPLLGQSGGYVISQYVAFGESFQRTTELGLTRPYAQVFGLLQVLGVTVPATVQTVVRGGAGLAVLGLLWFLRGRLPRERQAICYFVFTAACLQLFNPRSENNGYAILAPALGWLLGEAVVRWRDRRLAWGVGLAAGLTLLGYELQVRIAPQVRPIWLAPLMGLCYCGLQGVALIRELRQPLPAPAAEAILQPWATRRAETGAEQASPHPPAPVS
jgi:hypothetical protein